WWTRDNVVVARSPGNGWHEIGCCFQVKTLGGAQPIKNHIGALAGYIYAGQYHQFKVSGLGPEATCQNPILLTCRTHEAYAGGDRVTSGAAVVIASAIERGQRSATSRKDLQDGVEITAARTDTDNSAIGGSEGVPHPFAEIGLT